MFRQYLLIGYKLIILQLSILLIVAGISVFLGDWRGAISVLLGGSAWIIPSLYFVRKLFKPNTARNSEELLKDFLLGEALKILFSAGLIIFIMLFIPVKTTNFIGGYISTIAASFLIPFWVKNKK